MIELARSEDGLSFYVLEHSFELEKMAVGNFSYFRNLLGMTDYMANFRSWLKRSSVVLMVIVSDRTIVGWCMNERWTSPSRDGRPVFVLRAIEVSPDITRNGHGRNIFYLVSRFLPGHIITKPVNSNAKIFFEGLGFTSPDAGSAVSLMDYPGYVLLEESNKSSANADAVDIFENNLNACRMKMFPAEGQKEVTLSSSSGSIDSGVEGTFHESVMSDHNNEQMNDHCDDGDVVDNGFEGEFMGEQKMLSPCECGTYLAEKYLVNSNRHGTAYVCVSCSKERYFLPLK